MSHLNYKLVCFCMASANRFDKLEVKLPAITPAMLPPRAPLIPPRRLSLELSVSNVFVLNGCVASI